MALWMKARNQVINYRWIKTIETITIETFFFVLKLKKFMGEQKKNSEYIRRDWCC